MKALFEILIENAIRFRKLSDTPGIHFSAERGGDTWTLCARDNGIGIDPSQLEAVFLPFKRLHGREYPGSGLGLATAKLIARHHGGGIRVESEPDHGAAFLITLPDNLPASASL